MKLTERFINYIKYEKRYSSHTVRAYTDDIASFCSFLGVQDEAMLLEIKSKDIRSWLIYQMNQKNISPRTYKRKLSALKSFYKFLLRENLIKNIPSDVLVIPKNQNPLPEFYSCREISNLFEEINFPVGFKGYRDKLILHLFYVTGMRLSELINLKHKDIDFNLQLLHVTGKRNKQRNIPLSKSTLGLLKDYQQQVELEFGSININWNVFLKDDGGPVYPRLVQRLVQRYLSQVSTSEKTNPHKLRHTFATHLLNNGADLNAVKELLGHASLAATEVYTHNTYEKLKSVYKQAHPRA